MTALADTPVPVPRTFHLGDADSPLGAPFYVMERVVGHICRNALPPGYAETPGDRRRDRRGARRRARGSTHGRPRVGRPRRVRSSGRFHGAAAAPVVPAVGGVEDRRPARARPAARRPRRGACPSSRRARSSTATTVSTTRSCTPTEVGDDRRRARLGDEHARRSAGRPRRDAGVLERGGRLRGPAAGADHVAGDGRRGIPHVAPRSSSATRARPVSTSPTSTGISRLPTSSSRSCARGSPRAPPAAPWSEGASTARRAGRAARRGGPAAARRPAGRLSGRPVQVATGCGR